MAEASAALVSFLLSRRPCWSADLFTFTLQDGTELRWTSSRRKITADGSDFSAQGPLLQRGKLGLRNTVEVPTLEITMHALDGDFVGGKSVKRLIHDGGFDGAAVRLDRAFMPEKQDLSFGAVTRFLGRMSSAKIVASGATLTAKGSNVVMNQMAPRNTYQSGCVWPLFKGGCAADPAALTLTGAIVGGDSSNSFIVWDSVPGSPANYGLGKLTVTSGAALGEVRTVRFADGSGLQLTYPLFSTPAPGDTFDVREGCDKTSTRCAVIGQSQHRRGFEFLPQAEAAA